MSTDGAELSPPAVSSLYPMFIGRKAHFFSNSGDNPLFILCTVGLWTGFSCHLPSVAVFRTISPMDDLRKLTEIKLTAEVSCAG